LTLHKSAVTCHGTGRLVRQWEAVPCLKTPFGSFVVASLGCFQLAIQPPPSRRAGMELGSNPPRSRRALEDAGVIFIDRGKGGGPGVRLKA